MELVPQILSAKVMHKRLFPRINAFHYRIYYVAMPLPATQLPSVLQRFPQDDLGYQDGRGLETWVDECLAPYDLKSVIADVMVITMPRVLGYVFNPVTFYLCLDAEGQLRAVLSEVHNTFHEHHSYLCAHPDHRPITAREWLQAEKLFHVSPFLKRSGHYQFRFDVKDKRLGFFINYYDEEGQLQLTTSLMGTLAPLTASSLRWAFWSHPVVALKAMALIHWQAFKLVMKGIRYIAKPKPVPKTLTVSDNLTKM